MTALTWIAPRPDAELFAIADEDGRLRVWAPREDRVVARHLLGSRVWRAEWTADGAALVAVAAGGEELHVLSSDGARREATIATHHGEVTALAVHPSRAWAATTGRDGRVRLWDLAKRAVLRELDAGAPGSFVAMSEAHVAVGTKTGAFVVWVLESGKDVAGGDVFASYVSAMAFDGAGKWLVMGGGQGKLVALSTSSWDVTTVWRDTPPKPIATNAIHFAPDGRWVAAHSDDSISLFASAHDEHPRRMGSAFWLDRKPWDRRYIVSAACFVPKTKLVVSSHFDGRIRLWQDRGPLMLKAGELTLRDDDHPAIEGVADRVAWWRDRGPPAPAPVPAQVVPVPVAVPMPVAKAPSPEPEGVQRKCAACGADVVVPQPPRLAPAAVDDAQSGLDGRPHFTDARSLADDAAILFRESGLETCPACKHVAPRLDIAYPRIALAAEAREELFALTEHHEIARTYLYVAQLYNDEDPRREGWWALRAAWADEAHGNDAIARRLRHRAGLLLEDALLQGVALSRARCGSSLVLTEIFRVSGDFERAAEHCWRGISIRAGENDESPTLFVEGMYVVDRKTDVLTRARAQSELANVDARRKELRAALERPLAPIAIRPQRRFAEDSTGGMPPEDGLADMFLEDFRSAELAPEPGVIGAFNRRARTLAEMRFAASLRRCATCGAPPGELALSGSGRRFTLAALCPLCAVPQEYVFYTYGDPAASPCPPRELGKGRSEIVTAAELRAELERLRPRLEDPAVRERAITCATELLKLGHSDALVAELDRLVKPPKAPRVESVWRAGDQILVATGDGYVLLDASGKVVRRFSPHRLSDEEDLWTYAYAIVGEAFVERITVEHTGWTPTTRTDEERILEGLRAANDDATRRFVEAALARAPTR